MNSDMRDEKTIEKVTESFRYLLESEDIPDEIRSELEEDFEALRAMLDKIESRELHIAALGRVGVGKSALLNSLAGKKIFEVGVLFGVTEDWKSAAWENNEHPDLMAGAKLSGRLVLIDTPGFSEAGEQGVLRERISRAVAERADLILFVCDGDLTAPELSLLRELADLGKPLLVVLNKTDRLDDKDLALVLDSLKERWLKDLLDPADIVCASADPRPLIVLSESNGKETVEKKVKPSAEVEELRDRIWQVLQREGLDLLAVNSAIFASQLSDIVSSRVAELRQKLAERILTVYSTAKAVAVAVNPVPIADVLGGMATDVGMIVALARLHGMPMSWRAAEDLSATIGKQMLLLVGTEIVTHVVADILKGATFGLGTVFTALPQGMIAGYNSMVRGRAALVYFRQGFSWGKQGPKTVVKDILATVDRRSFLAQMKETLLVRIKSGN